MGTNHAKDRADAQRLVTARLLERLHDPLGHFSRLQRIHFPQRCNIAIRQLATGGLSPMPVTGLLRSTARRPIRIRLHQARTNRRVPARILT